MTGKNATAALREARRIVVKVGSSLVTNEGRGLDERAIGEWSRQLAALAGQGREVIMVSSGAIAEGMKRLGWASHPHELTRRLEVLVFHCDAPFGQNPGLRAWNHQPASAKANAAPAN